MGKDIVLLEEARRLHALGFAIHWLRPRSKIPLEKGWTTGPRKDWEYLRSSYAPGFNVGVRLGTASKIGMYYLAVLDVDVKSKNPTHINDAYNAAAKIISLTAPFVKSGRGNGSGHFYFLTKRPFKTWNPARSTDETRYLSPTKFPSKKELEKLGEKLVGEGWRLGPAWEISLYSDGRQVVLPPSVHPDTGATYGWEKPFGGVHELPVITFPDCPESTGIEKEVSGTVILDGFEPEPIELAWLPISDSVRNAIVTGAGVINRSDSLPRIARALRGAGLTKNEILTVLTEPSYFISSAARERRGGSLKSQADWLWEYTLKKIWDEKPGEVFRGLPIPEIEDKKEEEVNWRDGILRVKGPQGKPGHPLKLLQNVFLIVSKGVSSSAIQRDEFSFRDSYSCDTPWGGKKGDTISDGDVDEAQLWFGKNYEFEPPKNLIESAFTVIARRNSFDPVRDFLDSLPKWDEIPRLDTWLSKNFEGSGCPEYLAQVFRKWMVAMVMRVYKPGAKFDWMPIFEGAQGVGKSSFGRLLVGDKYFLDWLPNLHDKDSALSLQGMWGVEMGELSQFRRNELETIKAFITRTVDKVRPPFGKRVVEMPRRCVFFGTTNRETYLIDETGNRRFKPVVVGKLNFKALQEERLQLFSEAKWLFDQKKETEITLELSGAAQVFERQIHQEKMITDDSHFMEEAMKNFIEKVDKNLTVFDLQKFKLIDLFEGGGPFGGWKKDNRNLQFVAKMIKRMGAKKREIGGRNFWEIEQTDVF